MNRMPGLYLDVYSPTITESIAYIVQDSLVIVILLLIAVLLGAAILVNHFVLKKHSPAPKKIGSPDEPEDKK